MQVDNMHSKACMCLSVALSLLVLEVSQFGTKFVSAKGSGKLLGIVCRSRCASAALHSWHDIPEYMRDLFLGADQPIGWCYSICRCCQVL